MIAEVKMIPGTMNFQVIGVAGPQDSKIGKQGVGRSVAEALGNYCLRNPGLVGVTPCWQDTRETLQPFRELFEREDGTPTTCETDDSLPLPASDEMNRVMDQRASLPEGEHIRLRRMRLREALCDACDKPLSGIACTNPDCTYAPPVEDQVCR